MLIATIVGCLVSRHRPRWQALALLATLACLAWPAWSAEPPTLAAVVMPPLAFPVDPARAALGRQIFFDTRLSEPRGTSCASCHVPQRAYSGNHGSAIGVPLGSRPSLIGSRNTPSLLYTRYIPALYFYQDDDSLAPEPIGGLFADGRVNTLRALAKIPLLHPLEMHNRSEASLARKLQRLYLAELRQNFGVNDVAHPGPTIEALSLALEAFLQSDEMAPFSSRYDVYVQGRGQLSAQEKRGLSPFGNPDKGNCIGCHKFDATARAPTRSLFTDFSYDALAAPRNSAIPANSAEQYFDTGICKTAQTQGWRNPEQWCGYFRTPSLRNVAVRERFMHNGAFSKLREVVEFYATRSTNPEKWYRSGGTFNDLPERYRGNVNINSAPYNRRAGSTPALTPTEIDDIVAFLATLTDAQFLKPPFLKPPPLKRIENIDRKN